MPVPRVSGIRVQEYSLPSPGDDSREFGDPPWAHNRPSPEAITGMILGMVLGAGIWSGLLVMIGAIKL